MPRTAEIRWSNGIRRNIVRSHPEENEKYPDNGSLGRQGSGQRAFFRSRIADIGICRVKTGLDIALPEPDRGEKSESAVSDEALFILFGKVYRLTVREGMTMSLDISGADAVLTLPPGTDSVRAEEFTDAWRRGALKEKIAQLLPQWERRTGLYCREWRIKKMNTRWGTCNTAAKRIWFSLMLSEKRTECIEYVILHELLHLEIPDHGAGFKAASDRYMPGWREIKRSITAPPGGISGEKND